MKIPKLRAGNKKQEGRDQGTGVWNWPYGKAWQEIEELVLEIQLTEVV